MKKMNLLQRVLELVKTEYYDAVNLGMAPKLKVDLQTGVLGLEILVKQLSESFTQDGNTFSNDMFIISLDHMEALDDSMNAQVENGVTKTSANVHVFCFGNFLDTIKI